MTPELMHYMAQRGCDTRSLERQHEEQRTISVGNVGQMIRRHARENTHFIYVGRWNTAQLGTRLPVLSVINSLGNPHPLAPYRCNACDCTHGRGEAVEIYKLDLARDAAMQSAAFNMLKIIIESPLPHIELLCHCSPQVCHADVLAHKVCHHLPNFTRV